MEIYNWTEQNCTVVYKSFRAHFGQHSSPCMEFFLFVDMTVFLTKSNLTKPNITIQKNFLTLYVWTVCQVTECQVDWVPSWSEPSAKCDWVPSGLSAKLKLTECKVWLSAKWVFSYYPIFGQSVWWNLLKKMLFHEACLVSLCFRYISLMIWSLQSAFYFGG